MRPTSARVGRAPQHQGDRMFALPGTALVYACCPSGVGNSAPFPSQKWPCSGDK